MSRVKLLWVETPALAGLEPEALARELELSLASPSDPSPLVISLGLEQAPPSLRQSREDLPTIWLDLAAQVGSGEPGHRQARALAALARATAHLKAGLDQAPAPAEAIQPAVLVVGQGISALMAAGQAAELGHPVLWALPGDDPAAPAPDEDGELSARLAAELSPLVELALGAELKDLRGGAGDYKAWLQLGGSRMGPLPCGAVVLAPAGQLVPSLEPGLDPDWAQPWDQVDLAGISGPEDGWLRAVVLAGVSAPLSAPAFARALTLALALQQRPRVQTTLLFSEARVGFSGGERLYRQARQAGVLAARVEPGGLRADPDHRGLSWWDPLLGEQIELIPDLVFSAPEAQADLPAFLDNPLLWPPAQELTSERVRLAGGLSAQSGLYVLGAARGASPDQRPAQACAAVAHLHELLSAPVGQALVSQARCASCLTCVRVCPHGAPRFQEDRIVCAPAACLACGICAAECPAEAIAPQGWSNDELFAGLAAGLERAQGEKLVLFACAQSAQPALAQLGRQGHQWPLGLVVAPVNCAGRVGLAAIFKALALGAQGVLVASCQEGNCRSLAGNLRARLRTRQARELLQEMGVDDRRVVFLNMASNQPQRLARAVQELSQA